MKKGEIVTTIEELQQAQKNYCKVLRNIGPDFYQGTKTLDEKELESVSNEVEAQMIISMIIFMIACFSIFEFPSSLLFSVIKVIALGCGAIGIVESVLFEDTIKLRKLKKIASRRGITVKNLKGEMTLDKCEIYQEAIEEDIRWEKETSLKPYEVAVTKASQEVEKTREKLCSFAFARKASEMLDYGSIRLFHEQPYLKTLDDSYDRWKKETDLFTPKTLVKKK